MKKDFLIVILILVILIVFINLNLRIGNDKTYAIVMDGTVYAYMDDYNEFGKMGDVEEFDWYLEDGIYIITWSGDIYENRQDIVKVYDVIKRLVI